MKKLLFVVALMFMSMALYACQNTEEKTFTLAELSEFDGQNGAKAYVAVDGIVYDVSDADGWENGYHNDVLLAGTDATAAFESSPHSQSTLDDLPKVGVLKTP